MFKLLVCVVLRLFRLLTVLYPLSLFQVSEGTAVPYLVLMLSCNANNVAQANLDNC